MPRGCPGHDSYPTSSADLRSARSYRCDRLLHPPNPPLQRLFLSYTGGLLVTTQSGHSRIGSFQILV